ncbi:methylmalonyl Co-A mutase-associated GTPase MeaB [Porticoccaceae bacterium]|jgi:LAO/AO transport system kinase|nr:methylmalonyl Co-A mutase-associated GTPase MeaB [Porticoccaceae bacterium]MDB2382379.1 methylmalonyl Co-A mutase-associated GTPase MeaB [Porticoccaceae bacterium]MDB2566408.1 methylmalonyl Co-A mutase-associated GTPase MeaB [Porticoccaceae bacterium]MDB2621504.1 methylmalonyl Co-A mutase-associated GTPase MeaB [Porticoccaceae bacterium]
MTQATKTLADQVRQGDRRALAKAITLAESTRDDHRQQTAELLETLIPASGNSIRIGISGAPGVGKSTFIEVLGSHLIKLGHSVAVLAVDPSSAVTGGSILGDKTRMETLAFAEKAFVRPSPAGSTLGGVARRTRESMLLCEAAGFDIILVETVGVGQSETTVADMTDMFLLLLLPAGGDELQGIKRGIMELADLILVNKADGDQVALAARTMGDYRSAVQFLASRFDDWQTPVMSCSSINDEGIVEVWGQVDAFKKILSETGQLQQRRAEQAKAWMWSEMTESLVADLKADERIRSLVPDIESAVLAGELPATVAAQRVLNLYKDR